MANSDALDEATSRLTSALERFESMVAERRQRELSAEALEEKLQQLTSTLDAEKARSERLENANDAVSERLDELIGAIKSVLRNG